MKYNRDEKQKWRILYVGILLSLIGYTSFNLIWAFSHEEPLDIACQEIGFDRYKYKSGSYQDFCVDNFNNEWHYVEMNCNNWFYLPKIKCIAKEISIGDVRVFRNEKDL